MWLVIFTGALTHSSGCAHQKSYNYPESATGSVVDVYHGVKVADPYRWLEDSKSDETKAWIAAQNELTQSHLKGLEHKEPLKERLRTLWNYERFGAPRRVGEHYYYRHNSGLQQHSTLMVSKGLEGKARVLLDPNTFSKDGSVSLGSYAPSEDGRWLAYMVSDGGSDWREIKVMDTETGEHAETLKWVKWSGISWRKDGSGFFYSRFPEPKDKLQQTNENHRVFFHRLGDNQEQDQVVFAQPQEPEWHVGGWVSDDDQLLWLYAKKDTDNRNLLWFKRLSDLGAEPTVVLPDWSSGTWPIGKIENTVWLKTNSGAPKQRIMKMTLDKPLQANWTDVVPERAETLRSASVVGGHLLLSFLKDAHAVAERFTLEGKSLGELELPGIGSVWGLGGRVDDPDVFYVYSDFTRPSSIYRLDVKSGKSSLYRAPKLAFDSGSYTSRQVFFTSKDGTKVPMFLIHKKGLKPGPHPTLLYGYGGFNVSLTPYFSVGRAVWLEQGGIYAIANLRGGGEYGEAWHKAGTKTNKQNVFDDFIAASEYLIKEKISSPDKLGINGGSNGGLLVAAAMLQRPELFGAVLPDVGVLDMLRYHLFTVGKRWASDYGTVEDEAEFKALLRYSPVHNTTAGQSYPPTMISTADHDDRVVPAHSYKFAAALQSAQGGKAPIMIRIETRVGHGAGRALSLTIEKLADQYSFLMRHLGMSVD